jgi:hypothetical protein
VTRRRLLQICNIKKWDIQAYYGQLAVGLMRDSTGGATAPGRRRAPARPSITAT